MELQVRDEPSRNRYEAWSEGALAGFTQYVPADLRRYGLDAELLVVTHTEVDPSYEGQGVGTALVRGALDDVRRRSALVLPLCPFVRGWIEHHPDYRDLVFEPPPSRVSD
jgi:uncharacterized protein